MDPTVTPEVANKEKEVTTPVVEAPIEQKVEPRKLTEDIELPSGKITIHKLKAGKFYEAQQLYVKWISVLQQMIAKAAPKKVEEGEEKTEGVNLEGMIGTVEESNKLRISLLSCCLDIPEEEIVERFYADELDLLFNRVIAINDFLDYLGKSAYLTAGNIVKMNQIV